VSLGQLLASRRVILCVGCGGVGKTTTAAAIGLAAAARGRRTLCLTVDPARRLAESLGLSEMKHEAQLVEPSRFREAGLDVKGSLTVMMLDTKGTFDELVNRYASSPEVRDRILRNTLYRYISTSLAGTAEYMAMERLYALRTDPRWDLIVIDTPPTTNALDFLDAPERMIEALDSPVFRWLVSAFESTGATGKFSVNLLARGAAAALRAMGRLTGAGFLEALAELIVLLNDMLGGFRARADEVRQALRGPEVAYVLVTSPDPLSIREIEFFAERLRELSMPRDAVVINRLHPPPGERPTPEALRALLEERGLPLAGDGEMRVLRAFDDEARQSDLDHRYLGRLASLENGEERPIRVEVPALIGDVHDLRALAKVAAALAPL
jgi:anion-transporting  ArsA/GET3 family ATPase